MGEGRDKSDLLRLSAVLALSAAGCFLLFALRVAISGRTYYRYLVWNLLLAAAPYVIAVVGLDLAERAGAAKPRLRAALAVATAALWILFYPNAPYIFTDFIHVINRTYLRPVPAEWLGTTALLWYDLLMNAAFAFMGHFIGLVSMWLVHSGLARLWGSRAARLVVAAAILLAGFGIYLGRFSRLNSWDLLLDPARVWAELSEATADIKALLFSAGFSLFILLSYAALVMFKRIDMPGIRGRKD